MSAWEILLRIFRSDHKLTRDFSTLFFNGILADRVETAPSEW